MTPEPANLSATSLCKRFL